MRYDPDTTYRLAVGAVASGLLWVVAYAILAAGPYIAKTGNTRRLIAADTHYSTYLGYAYGAHPWVMWPVTLATLAFAAAWLYRAWADDWAALYAS